MNLADVPVVELDGVGRTYPGSPEVVALRPTSHAILRGDYVAVVGPSGSGKSTLVNILGLLDRPSSGVYRFDGIDVATLSEAERTALRGRRVGIVFQAFHLLPDRSAVENVALARLYTTAESTRARLAVAYEALARVDLSHRADALPTRLSGGERQRVAIARGLVNRPSVLLCDEPTGNLDSAATANVLDLLDDLHRDGLTIVVITHDVAVAARADRILVLRDGVLSATPRAS
ncbi:MAG TPA: ABC transporter ATP-binding protein [Mycobacteriales bacterium]|jgi:putative ABC transport system ATP-binding protein|nr:ABC transporter ATP-binding protein [Mycobacteriales bacterium]